MRMKKWLMKQQWRVVQIRGIWSLFYGILLLSIAYYEYIPYFANMGSLGPFVFASFILGIFLILGYIYDRVLVMWAASQEVTQERNPYQFVPSPKDHIFWFPIYSALLDSTEQLADKFNVDKRAIQEAREYYGKLQKFRPERKEDIDKAIELREAFVDEHPFSGIKDEDRE